MMRARPLTALLTTVMFLLSLVWLATPALAGRPHRVEVCHVPPGNPANAHTIRISPNALWAHLRHGDVPGACNLTSELTTALRDHVLALHAREFHPKRRRELFALLDTVDSARGPRSRTARRS